MMNQRGSDRMKQRKSVESAELALLLKKLSSDDSNSGRLLGELVSIVRRPSTARNTGNAELGLLRQSPGDQKIASAAADVILERAHADPAFGAALASWLGKEPVRAYLSRGTARQKAREDVATPGPWWRKPAVWIIGIVASAIAAVLTGWLTAGLQDLGDLHKPASVPFTWTIVRSGKALNFCQSWLFPQPISKFPVRAFGDSEADEAWALGNHGTDVFDAAWTITLQGLSSDSVAIQDVRVKVVSKRVIPRGTRITSAFGCGAVIPVRYFDVAVDSPGLKITPRNGAASWPYSISSTDVEELSLNAYIGSAETRYEYSFVYEVAWAQGARTGTADITLPGGRPFTLIPQVPGAPLYYVYDGKWAVGQD